MCTACEVGRSWLMANTREYVSPGGVAMASCIVRDALTMGPTRGEDGVTPHTRPPADEDADHLLVRTVLCLEGEVEVELICEPVFDYGRTPAEWTLVDGERHAADASGAGQTIRLQTDMALGIEGNRVRARHALRQGEKLYCSLSWAEGLASPADADDAFGRLSATTSYWRSWLGRARIRPVVATPGTRRARRRVLAAPTGGLEGALTFVSQ